MTTAVKKLLKSFEQLNQAERRAAALEIFRRTGRLDSPPVTEEELTAIAAERFLALDAREAENGQS